MITNHNLNNNNKNNDHGGRGGGGESTSSETSHDGKKGGSPGSDTIPIVWPPKFVIAMTNKEKEEDSMAIKGSKLPQRPKKRAKFIQLTFNIYLDIAASYGVQPVSLASRCILIYLRVACFHHQFVCDFSSSTQAGLPTFTEGQMLIFIGWEILKNLYLEHWYRKYLNLKDLDLDCS